MSVTDLEWISASKDTNDIYPNQANKKFCTPVNTSKAH